MKCRFAAVLVEIRLRAERKAGQLLLATAKNGERATGDKGRQKE